MLRQPASPLLPPLVQLLSTSMRSWLLCAAPASAPFAAAGLHTSGPSCAAPALQAYTERAARYAHVKSSSSSSSGSGAGSSGSGAGSSGSGAGSSGSGASSSGSQEVHRPRQSAPAQQQQQQQHDPLSSGMVAATPRMALASCDIISPSSIYQVYDAEDLTFSWLSHWRKTEEKLRFETAVAQQTRGRRLQRRRTLNAMVAPPQQQQQSEQGQQQPGEGSGGSSSSSAALAMAAAEASARAGRPAPVEGSEGPQRSSTATSTTAAKATAGLGSSTSASAAVPRCTVGGVPGRGVTELIGSSRGSGRMGDMEWLYGLPDEEEEEGEEAEQPVWMSWVSSGSEGEEEEGALGPVRLRLGGGRRGVIIRPLWICVHQEEGAKEARLYESIFPLDEGLFSQLQAPLSPFCTTSGLRFGAGDVGSGPWRNYFVGVVGSVGAVADEALWPNQILHGDRLMWNVRDALDVARFLALPERADMEAHAARLRRIAEERGRRKGWCWHMLRQRWGEAALQEHGIQV